MPSSLTGGTNAVDCNACGTVVVTSGCAGASVANCCPETGPTVGRALVSAPRIAGVCFTGSTETARTNNRAMAIPKTLL